VKTKGEMMTGDVNNWLVTDPAIKATTLEMDEMVRSFIYPWSLRSPLLFTTTVADSEVAIHSSHCGLPYSHVLLIFHRANCAQLRSSLAGHLLAKSEDGFEIVLRESCLLNSECITFGEPFSIFINISCGM